MQQWVFLVLAISFEVIGTSALKASEGFSRFWPSVLVVGGYGLAFYLLSLTLRTMPVSIAYAVWAGVGVALMAFVGWLVFDESLDAPAIIGILLIVSGVVVLNGFSDTAAH